MPEVRIRQATPGDLVAIVALLADDDLGRGREEPGPASAADYERAFAEIDADPRTALLVAERDGVVSGTLQLTFIRHLTYRGGERAQVEAVRVARDARRTAVGRLLLEEAIRRARERGCHLVQLTTDVRRPEALAFYQLFGFRATHHGLKLQLAP